ADALVQEHSAGLQLATEIAEHIFVVVFTVEIVLRTYVYSCRIYIPNSVEHLINLLDAVLVVITGIILAWVIPLIALIQGQPFGSGFLRTLSVFRAVRLLRIVRVINQIAMFREVWLLLQGLRDSLRTLFWTVLVIFIITYIFSIFGCWMIGSEIIYLWETTDDESRRQRIDAAVARCEAPIHPDFLVKKTHEAPATATADGVSEPPAKKQKKDRGMNKSKERRENVAAMKKAGWMKGLRLRRSSCVLVARLWRVESG
ncbi:unnamed protein product, partial [Symbiodinium natans]